MKRNIIFTLLLALGLSAFAQSTKPRWTSITSSGPETFKTQLISSTENSIKVNVQVPGFYATSVTTPRGEANIISVPKSVSTAQAGEPNVPMTGIPVMIGDKARMNARIIDAQYMDFEGIEVAPSKGDFSRQIDPATVPYTYGECYSQDAFFPTSNLDLHEPYIIRDFRGQNMAVYPFAYNPVSKTLRVYYNMTVEMYKVDNKGENVIESRRSNVVKMDPDFKSVYQRHFINYEASMAKYTPVDEEGDLLIICYSSFMNAMTDFVNWKKTRGINTTIVNASTAGSSYSAIKTYIQNQYNANNNLTHVLLVGDVAQIPGYTYSGASGYEGKGDNPYGQVVGNDIYNDIFVGRFSAQTAAQVTTQVNRVITYERDLTTSDTWLGKADGISRNEGGSGHNGEDDYQHMDVIRTDLLNYGYNTVYQDYENLSGYTGTASSISSHINSGVGIVNYCNHGNTQLWGVASYSNTQVNNLTNKNKLPFIWSVACLVGKYDNTSTSYGSNYTIGQSNDCFAESWMHATYSSSDLTPTGAVGALMSYISQPWIPPMWAQDECIDILIESYSNNIKHTWGGTSINGIMGIFDHYSTSTAQAVGTYQAWVLYGDPSMMLRTKTPQAMTVSHAGAIALGANSYSVSVNNGNGTLATITDANHNILGRATVSNGTANISIDGNSLTPNEELTLCVFGYNKVTYLGTITVVGGEQYDISASADPTEGGTVSGAGTYYESTQCTLIATANPHYDFSKWTKDGTQVSTNSSYSFTVTGNANYVAHFVALNPHTVTCNTVQNGSISANPTTAYKNETVTLTADPDAGYYLGVWTVTAGNQTIPVTNNQFIMPDSDVTVSATFVTGYNVTLASVMNGSISATPTGGPAGMQVTLTATPATGYHLDSWVVFKTGDMSTTVTVTNNKFTMPNYDVTVSAIFSKPQGGDVTIGSGTSTNNYIPTYSYYKYTLSQQLFTSSEVGDAGTITKVAFKVANSKSTTRNIDIYLSHTSKSSFTASSGWSTSSSDWVAQSTSYRVFSGSVTFNASGWTTITLTTPFEYNGTSNLLLTVDDNTGTYVSSTSDSPTFYVYSTSDYTSLYKYNDDTNYNPASMSTSGTPLKYKNQVVFTKEVPSTEGYLSVSPTTLTGFEAFSGSAASEPQGIAVIGSNLQSNVSVTPPTGYEVCTMSNGTYTNAMTLTPTNGELRQMVYVRLQGDLTEGDYNGTMTIASGTIATNIDLSGTVTLDVDRFTITATANPAAYGGVTFGTTFVEGNELDFDFEDNTTQGWTLLQGPNSDSPDNWMHCSNYTTDDFSSGFGHNLTNGFMISESLINNSTPVHPDNYLVSPQIMLGGSIHFWATNLDNNYGEEHFAVAVSTNGNTDASDFTTVQEWTLPSAKTGNTRSIDDGNWYEYTADLSAFTGMGYVAIHHFDCYDQWLLCVDDITIIEGMDNSTCSAVFIQDESCTVTAVPNEGYTFVNWTENGDEVSSSATYTFSVTEDRDLVANFSNETTQSITLSSGWCWWSPNVIVTLNELKSAIADAMGSNGTATIKSKDGSITYSNGQWRGSLKSLDVTQMYMIRTSTPCEITLEGSPVSAQQTITIASGNNWIAFPLNESMSVNEAFQGFPENGDIIKSKNTSAAFNGSTWRGTLQNLEPGHGYVYQSKAQGDKTLTFPANK